jgi:hypothetical protein
MNYVRAGEGDGIKLIGNLINKGQSPALEVEAGGLLGTNKPITGNAIDRRITMSPINSYFAPSIEQENVIVTIPFKTFLPDKDSGDALWFLIIIRYRDVFRVEQHASFRGQFLGSDLAPLSVNGLVFAAEIDGVHVSMT